MKIGTDDGLFSAVNPFRDLSGDLPDLPTRRPVVSPRPADPPLPQVPTSHVAPICRGRTALLVEIERGGRTDPANLLATSSDVLEVALHSKDEARIAGHIASVVDLLHQHVGLFGDVDGNVADALAAIFALDARYSKDQPRVEGGEHAGEWATSAGGQLEYSGLAEAAQRGGFSVTVHGSAPKTGFMVSPYKKAERRYSAETFSRSDVHDYRDSHRTLLARPDHYLGGWRDGDTIYLDVSIHATTREDAQAIARQHGQLAFYDLDTGTTVPTEAAA